MASKFRHLHRVTYSDCTMGNHVYHARYLDILEAARGEFFRAAGVPLASLHEHGLFFPVVESHLHHEDTAHYDDELVIEVVVTELDQQKIAFAYGVSNARNQILLSGLTRHICIGTDGQPKPMPPEFFERLSRAFADKPSPPPPPPRPACRRRPEGKSQACSARASNLRWFTCRSTPHSPSCADCPMLRLCVPSSPCCCSPPPLSPS